MYYILLPYYKSNIKVLNLNLPSTVQIEKPNLKTDFICFFFTLFYNKLYTELYLI